MGTKYTIEVEDKPFELLSEDGFTSEKLYRVKGFNSLMFDWNGLNKLTPYTEPDLDAIRKEACEEGYKKAKAEYNKDWNEAYEKGYRYAECACNSLALKNIQEAEERGYEKGLSDSKNQDAKDFGDMYDSGYSEGLKDAWDAARKICTNWVLPDSVLSEIFGMDKTIDDIMKETTASEAIEKIRQYEQEQEEIRVGDEVIGIYSSGEQTKPFVITKVISDYYFGIYSDSGEFCQCGLKLKKTGRHFPEIAEVLKEMREE